MRAFLQTIAVLLLCAGMFCLAYAQAQVPMTGAGKGAPGGGGAFSWNPNSTQPAAQNAGFGTTATFNVTLDTTPASSDIIVIGVGNLSGSIALNSVTVNGGSSLTAISQSFTVAPAASLYQTTGITTATLSIVLTITTGGLANCSIAVGVIKNAISGTATAIGNNNQNNQADPQNLTGGTGPLTVPSGGVGVYYFAVAKQGVASDSASTLVSASNVNETTYAAVMGYQLTAGSWNPSISGSTNFSFSGASIAAAAWH